MEPARGFETGSGGSSTESIGAQEKLQRFTHHSNGFHYLHQARIRQFTGSAKKNLMVDLPRRG
jgi:hypothetical protein